MDNAVKFCDPNCIYLEPKESEQNHSLKNQIVHRCKKFNFPVHHYQYYPNLVRAPGCNDMTYNIMTKEGM
ncbi:MAG TPA: hypothetical protein DDW65_21705 [Firmicutes bacterium]|nr:hypothetical protein [Bacillota bacterium]